MPWLAREPASKLSGAPRRAYSQDMVGPLKKPLWICPSGLKEIQNALRNSLSPLGAQNKDLGVAKQAISDHARRFFSRPSSRDFPTACVLERGVILRKLNDL